LTRRCDQRFARCRAAEVVIELVNKAPLGKDDDDDA
jgi:hypothetical protein